MKLDKISAANTALTYSNLQATPITLVTLAEAYKDILILQIEIPTNR